MNAYLDGDVKDKPGIKIQIIEALKPMVEYEIKQNGLYFSKFIDEDDLRSILYLWIIDAIDKYSPEHTPAISYFHCCIKHAISKEISKIKIY